MGNPFDLKTALLAKHAQHVVLIHFPVALFITGVAVAAISTIPVLATGLLAWQFQLEGQKVKGTLLLHLVLACVLA